MELSKEKSEELASNIEGIKLFLMSVDLDYAKEVSKSMRQQASWQDSAAVLNSMYNPDKQNILRKQSEMLGCIIKFIELGKETDAMKKKVAQVDAMQQNVMKMFI